MELHKLKAPLGSHPLPAAVANSLLKALWNIDSQHGKSSTDLTSYIQDYSKRCRRFACDGGVYLSVHNHEEAVAITEKILQDMPRENIRKSLLASAGSGSPKNGAEAVDTSIDLCASLLSMVEVGEHEFGFSECTPLFWEAGSFRQCLAEHFTPQTVLSIDKPRFGYLFTARNLIRISGIKIRWTTNLVDHLLLTDDDQSVFIFRCAGFLKLQQSLADPLLQPDFVSETLRTLALLFPQNDPPTSRWLLSTPDQRTIDRTSPSPSLLQELSRCGSLRTHERRLEHFKFWRDRLVILKQAFDESHPRTLPQWWADRRNGVQWYTFWVAVLVFAITITFGVVQTIQGGLQVWLSWRALQLQVQQGGGRW